MYKLIILVIANRGEVYDKFVNIYWKKFIEYSNKLGQIKIFLLYGNENIECFSDINDNIIKFSEKDSLIPGILNKTLYSFEYLNNNYEFNYILRTNLSSFFIYDKLIKLIDTFNKTNFLSGPLGPTFIKLNSQDEYDKKLDYFVSGTAIIMSKDIIINVLNNKNDLNYSLFDDVALSNLLNTTKRIEQKRYDITNITRINKNMLDFYCDEIIKNNHYHVRIKTKKRILCEPIIIEFLVKKFYNNFSS